jgi:F-type H+-transporting ATPase subunit epsilon
MKLEIITPFGRMLGIDCDEAVVPGELGEFGALPQHSALLTTVPSGLLWYRKNGEVKYMAVSNGYCEVYDDRILLLVESAETPESIDEKRAEAKRAQILAELDAYSGSMDTPAARLLKVRLRREEARLEAAKKR